MIVAAFVASALFAQALPATPADPSAAAARSVSPVTVPGRKAAAPDQLKTQNELICHDEQVLGTLFPKRTCATREDMADRRRVDQKSTRELQTPFEVIPIDAKK